MAKAPLEPAVIEALEGVVDIAERGGDRRQDGAKKPNEPPQPKQRQRKDPGEKRREPAAHRVSEPA